ncbi:MAG: radical SAM protein [Candidatus Omnitrophota bacterium]
MKLLIKLSKYTTLLEAVFHKQRFKFILKALFSYLQKSPELKSLPILVQIEPTNHCNLKCSLCAIGQGELKRTPGNMDFNTFKLILDELEKTIFYLALYNLGEPFLNPEIFKMISYAKSKNIFVKLSTNGNFPSPETIKNIIDSGADEILISLDCATPASYANYKRSGDFKKVLENIRILTTSRDRLRKPHIVLQLLLMRETENEISHFKKIAKDLKVDKILLKKVRINSLHMPPRENYLPKNKKYIRSYYKNNFTKPSCMHPWISSVIFWDGTVAPCCFDMEGEYALGNINDQKISVIWNSPQYIEFRQKLKENRQLSPLCEKCSIEGFSFYLKSLFT